MSDHRGVIAEIRYGASYASVLTFRFWVDLPDAWSDPRIDALVRRNASGTRTSGVGYGHDQKLAGTVRRIPRADVVSGARTISGWPLWRTWLRDHAWAGLPWRWVYQAGTYSGGDAATFFDAEIIEPTADWGDGPELEGDGMRRFALSILRKNGALTTGPAVEGY